MLRFTAQHIYCKIPSTQTMTNHHASSPLCVYPWIFHKWHAADVVVKHIKYWCAVCLPFWYFVFLRHWRRHHSCCPNSYCCFVRYEALGFSCTLLAGLMGKISQSNVHATEGWMISAPIDSHMIPPPPPSDLSIQCLIILSYNYTQTVLVILSEITVEAAKKSICTAHKPYSALWVTRTSGFTLAEWLDMNEHEIWLKAFSKCQTIQLVSVRFGRTRKLYLSTLSHMACMLLNHTLLVSDYYRLGKVEGGGWGGPYQIILDYQQPHPIWTIPWRVKSLRAVAFSLTHLR